MADSKATCPDRLELVEKKMSALVIAEWRKEVRLSIPEGVLGQRDLDPSEVDEEWIAFEEKEKAPRPLYMWKEIELWDDEEDEEFFDHLIDMEAITDEEEELEGGEMGYAIATDGFGDEEEVVGCLDDAGVITDFEEFEESHLRCD
ncbi:hypothetical protein YB2330_003975 [Saitoella coloradoensis]